VGEPARKPDLREQIGVALNASTMVMREGVETSLDRVAALGAAGLAVQLGADRRDLPIAACRDQPANEENIIAAELASVLWHIRYGGQINAVPQAIILFATWLSARGRYSKIDPLKRIVLMPKLAACALHEWLSDRCVACCGSGKQERTNTGSWVKPRGSMQRNAVFRVCRVCHGSARRLHGDRERARSLGLSNEAYAAERWDAAVRGAVAHLARILTSRLRSPLTAELERRKRRS
jgi:hypothetical protein